MTDLYRHKKSGGVYSVLREDAWIESTGELAVVYLSLSDGRVWVRPFVEFFDGRFDPLPVDYDTTYPQPEHGWTCFHCGETFKKIGTARDHFGETPDGVTRCMAGAGNRANLPPSPYDYTTAAPIGEHHGKGHVYIVDANSRNIACVWGPPDQKMAMARLIIEASGGEMPTDGDA